MGDDLEAIADTVQRACDMMEAGGSAASCRRNMELAERLRNGNQDALVTVISEVTGGMGSMNDQYLGRTADPDFRKLLNDIERLARAAAKKAGIGLIR